MRLSPPVWESPPASESITVLEPVATALDASLDGLTVDELLHEFRQTIGVSVRVVARLTALYVALRRHGVEASIDNGFYRRWLPALANGLVTVEAVAAYVDEPGLLQCVAKLPPDQQRRVVNEPVPVVPAVGMAAVPMTVRAAWEQGLKHVVTCGRVLSPDLQAKQLQAKAVVVKKPASKNTGDKKTPPLAPRGPATEGEVDALAARVEREIQARGGVRPTSRWIAEVVAGLCGWVPRGG